MIDVLTYLLFAVVGAAVGWTARGYYFERDEDNADV